MLEEMTKEEIVTLLKSAGNRIFSVKFYKRGTLEERHMVCRFGVTKGQTGEGLKFDPLEKGLIPVYDIQKAKELTDLGLDEVQVAKQSYRMINLDTVFWAKINGEEHV